MGIMTIKIDDELERTLRRKASLTRGLARGSISKSIEDAIRLWLATGSGEDTTPSRLFVAVKDGERVAEAETLEKLGRHLRDMGLDPREVVIESVPEGPRVERMGLRTSSWSQ
jgi:hypothetical protein